MNWKTYGHLKMKKVPAINLHVSRRKILALISEFI